MTYEQMELLIKALGVITALIITYVIKPLIDSKISLAEQEKLQKYIKAGVECAEQIFKTPGMGAEKKTYVMDYVSTLMHDKVNLDLTESQISDLIEAYVYEVKNHE